MLSQLPDIKKFNDVKRVTPVDNLVSEHQFSLAVSNPQRAMIEDDLLEFELFEKAKQEFGELDINGGDDLGEPFTPILAQHTSSLKIDDKDDQYNFDNDPDSSPLKSGIFPPTSKNPYLMGDDFPSIATINSVSAIKSVLKVANAIDHKIQVISSSKKNTHPSKHSTSSMSNIHNSSNFLEIIPTTLANNKTTSVTTKSIKIDHINKAKDIINGQHAFFGEFFQKKQTGSFVNIRDSHYAVRSFKQIADSSATIKSIANFNTNQKSMHIPPRPPAKKVVGKNSLKQSPRMQVDKEYSDQQEQAIQEHHLKDELRSQDGATRALASNIERLQQKLKLQKNSSSSNFSSSKQLYSSQSNLHQFKKTESLKPDLDLNLPHSSKPSLLKADSLIIEPQVVVVSPAHPWMHILRHRDSPTGTIDTILYQSDKDQVILNNRSVSDSSSNIDTELATAISIRPLPAQSISQDKEAFQLRSLDLLTDMSKPILLKVIKALFTNNGLDPYLVLLV